MIHSYYVNCAIGFQEVRKKPCNSQRMVPTVGGSYDDAWRSRFRPQTRIKYGFYGSENIIIIITGIMQLHTVAEEVILRLDSNIIIAH